MEHKIDLDDTAPSSSSHKKTKRRKRSTAPKLCDVFVSPQYTKRICGAQAMWVAVLTQAMMDALSKSKTAEAEYHKREAMHWLTSSNANFILVCQLAGFEPDVIRRKAKRALVSPAIWRAAPGEGKDYVRKKALRQRRKPTPQA